MVLKGDTHKHMYMYIYMHTYTTYTHTYTHMCIYIYQCIPLRAPSHPKNPHITPDKKGTQLFLLMIVTIRTKNKTILSNPTYPYINPIIILVTAKSTQLFLLDLLRQLAVLGLELPFGAFGQDFGLMALLGCRVWGLGFRV